MTASSARLQWGAKVGMAVGAVSLAAGLASPARAAVLASLAASWLFFAGTAAGAVALSAGVRVARGRWADPFFSAAEASTSFFAPAWLVLVVIVAGGKLWHPALAHGSVGNWLWVSGRDLLGAAVLFGVGTRWVRSARGAHPNLGWAIGYLLLYVVVLSTWAVDLIMDLREGAPSTAVPAYYFMGAWVCGLAWVTLASLLRSEAVPPAESRHDAGKLLFGMTTFLGYLLWSIYLPTWYANLPDETDVLLARWQGPYRVLTLLVLALAFLVPFVLLMPEATKRHRTALGAGAACVLVGMWAERFLLILPSLHAGTTALATVAAVGTGVGILGWFAQSAGRELGA